MGLFFAPKFIVCFIAIVVGGILLFVALNRFRDRDSKDAHIEIIMGFTTLLGLGMTAIGSLCGAMILGEVIRFSAINADDVRTLAAGRFENEKFSEEVTISNNRSISLFLNTLEGCTQTNNDFAKYIDRLTITLKNRDANARAWTFRVDREISGDRATDTFVIQHHSLGVDIGRFSCPETVIFVDTYLRDNLE